VIINHQRNFWIIRIYLGLPGKHGTSGNVSSQPFSTGFMGKSFAENTALSLTGLPKEEMGLRTVYTWYPREPGIRPCWQYGMVPAGEYNVVNEPFASVGFFWTTALEATKEA
jgi:hypothetical protein